MSPTEVSTPEPRALVGKTIKGRYRLLSVVGEGGMGAVYAAEHTEIGRRVAVKLVHAVHAGNPQIVWRLKQEARATGAIESEHVVQVLDAGEDEEHGLFVVMELLAGEDLEQRLSRETRLLPEEALRIADQAARGLARAHARGVIHRDLKPANVFLCTREDAAPAVKLVDFGIAKLVRDATTEASGEVTMHGLVVGTPQYMSPEQAQGLATIDARTDIYSLGALLYEMLVGEPPVPNLQNYEQKILHLVTKPRPRVRASIPDIDPALDELVAELLASDPDDRPPNMTAVRERLARLGARAANSEPPPPRATPTTFFSVAPPALEAVDGLTIASFTRATDARRLAWGAAVITIVAIAVGSVRVYAGTPPQVRERVAASAVVTHPKRLETSSAGVVRASVPVAPIPIAPVAPLGWVEPPKRSAEPRPLGGTGITQEF